MVTIDERIPRPCLYAVMKTDPQGRCGPKLLFASTNREYMLHLADRLGGYVEHLPGDPTLAELVKAREERSSAGTS